MNQKKIFLLGPTASGKTDLTKSCYDTFPIEIISVDSAQIYKGLNIGTAKPSEQELKSYPHHLINIINPDQSYSVAEFQRDSNRLCRQIWSKGKVPFFSGGTMMYFNALENPLDLIPPSTAESRAHMDQRLEEEGLEALYRALKKIDPDSSMKIKSTDTQRILRALEVYHLSNKPLSVFHSNHQKYNDKDVLKIGLFPQDRHLLHERIEMRVDKMISDGLLDEVKALKDSYNISKASNSMRSVGYRQALMYLDGQISDKDLRDQIIFATRQLAKRQLTWMRKMENLHVFDPFDAKLEGNVKQLIKDYLG